MMDEVDRLEAVRDVLDVMRRQEASHRRKHFSQLNESSSSDGVNAEKTRRPRSASPNSVSIASQNHDQIQFMQQRMQQHTHSRTLLLEWMYKIVEHCQLDDVAATLAIQLWDVGMLTSDSICMYPQLLAATCLQLALKVQQTTVLELPKLVHLGRGAFTHQDLISMEIILLRHMQWCITVPTITDYVAQYASFTRHHACDEDPFRSLLKTVLQIATSLQQPRADATSEEWAIACILFVFEHDSIISPHHQQAWILQMRACGVSISSTRITALLQRLRQALHQDTVRCSQYQHALETAAQVGDTVNAGNSGNNDSDNDNIKSNANDSIQTPNAKHLYTGRSPRHVLVDELQ
uniref:Cyclin-like domain-containing protein n=1 Tax=Craspedostauros australis TaxID=1486917 RepID=A0A6T6G7D7_9STRA|mmetsp:Transcript_22210/g.61844  ORF Transcript_22210/g.61844 Transcript_22210/m.61844 type:complete len:350 (+) Transcript_22210:218-1267(+)